MAIVTIAAAAVPATAQTLPPGATRWSPDGFVEYVVGNAPIVVSAGHGGDLRPPNIPDRTYGTFAKDSRTLELAREFALGLTARFGLRPHLVLCHLHRSKLDVNRDIVEAAQGDPLATQAYLAFHQACTDARNSVQATWGAGIYLDLHGHGHPENWIELGYALSSSQLALPDATLAQPAFLAQSTIRSVASLPGVWFPEILRGASSLGGHLQSGGFASVPSPANPHPNGGNYFDGGFNVRAYGSSGGGSVDGIQLETPWSVRSSVLVRTPFLDRVGGWLQAFFPSYRNLDPAAGSRVTITAVDAVASETGGVAELSVRRTGNLGSPRLVLLHVTGSAQAGADFQALPPYATFAVGVDEVRLPLRCLDDNQAEGDETVVVALFGGNDIGAPNRAEVVLHDDEPSGELALHLPLDQVANGTTPDLSPWQRTANLLPSGSGPSLVPGPRATALRFDGVDDRVRIADFSYAPTGEFSVSFWFRASAATGTGFRYLMSHGGTSATHRLGIYFDQTAGTLRTALLYGNDLTSLDVLDVTRDLRDGQWHHYALVAHTDDLVRVYIDGAPVTAAQFLGDTLDPAGDFVLGARSDLSATTFAAVDLDEVQVWNRALAPVEVTMLHTGLGSAAMVHPGSTTDLELATGIDRVPTAGPRQDVKHATGGNQLTATYRSPSGLLQGHIAALVADLFVTGAPPTHPLFPEVHTGSTPLVVHGPALLSPAGGSWPFAVPAGFAGISLVLQPVALTTQAPNGLFAAGAAHEVRLH